MSQQTRNLLIHFAQHLISIGHPDVASEILTMCGVALVRVTISLDEGYADMWDRPEVPLSDLLDFDVKSTEGAN